MVGKKSASRYVFLTFDYIFMAIIAFICFVPIWHVVMASISDPARVTTNTGIILKPLGETSLNGFLYLLNYKNIWVGYRNTLIYVVLQCVITTIPTFVGGYVLSRKRLWIRNGVTVFLTFTMLFNGGMIPTYMVVRNLGLLDTIWAVLIPTALNMYYLIIMRTAVSQIPDSLEESARVDGAGELRIMFSIYFPLCKATIAVIILFVAVAKWNEYMQALLYISDKQLYPLQMFLRQILIEQQTVTPDNASMTNDTFMNNTALYKQLVKYCSIVVSTLPILCIYPFVQKYFVSGMTIGAVKG